MKKLLSSVNITEVGLLKSILEEEGIVCTIRNQQLAMLSGEVPFTECYPELWVLNDEDFDKAQDLFATWENQEAQQLEPWTCPRCEEENEGQFGPCWQCGYMIDEPVQQ